jgi:hypothetical protein
MTRKALVVLLVPLTLGLVANAAIAASPHLKGRNPVAFTDNVLTLTGTASYAGLGNFDTLQTLTATGGTVSTCTTPSGSNEAPGQNPAPVTLVGSTPVLASDIKNGNVTISTTTAAPTSPVPGSPGCPNSSWIERITDVSFTSATITVSQDQDANGSFETVVLTVNCTFSPPTSNGSVPTSGFTCTTA